MTAACARCGSCCDPVILAADVAFRCAERARSQEQPDADDTFVTQHWHPESAWTDDGRTAWLLMRCDVFDPESRLCRDPGNRPPVCRGYPWYSDGPTADRGTEMRPHCSFLADLPPGQRPEDARPLIPLTVISTREAA